MNLACKYEYINYPYIFQYKDASYYRYGHLALNGQFLMCKDKHKIQLCISLGIYEFLHRIDDHLDDHKFQRIDSFARCIMVFFHILIDRHEMFHNYSHLYDWVLMNRVSHNFYIFYYNKILLGYRCRVQFRVWVYMSL